MLLLSLDRQLVITSITIRYTHKNNIDDNLFCSSVFLFLKVTFESYYILIHIIVSIAAYDMTWVNMIGMKVIIMYEFE